MIRVSRLDGATEERVTLAPGWLAGCDDLFSKAVPRSTDRAWCRKDPRLLPFEWDPVFGLLSQPCEYTALCWRSFPSSRRKSQGFNSCAGLKSCLCASLCGVVTSDLPLPWFERRRGLSSSSLSFRNWGGLFCQVSPLTLGMLWFFFFSRFPPPSSFPLHLGKPILCFGPGWCGCPGHRWPLSSEALRWTR